MARQGVFHLGRLVPAAMLLLAVAKLPYEYYEFLRLVAHDTTSWDELLRVA